MVTSRDVARLAGVSQATVSRALSSSASLAPQTRARVQEAVERLGYVPHAGAQAMKTRRTRTIGVVVDDLTNPFYPEVLDELTRQLDEADHRVVLWNAGSAGHRDALAAIRERAVDGVVFTTATGDSLELQAAVEKNSPLVLINRVVEGLDCDQVTSSNRAGGAAVAEYLASHGKTRIAFIGGAENASTSRDRGEGFLSRLAELGHIVPAGLRLTGSFTHQTGAEAAGKLLDLAVPPDAVFCANDFIAFGALDAIRGRGGAGNAPWVVGYDDVEMASWPSLDLTTVRQPSRDMARAGARMLLDRIASPGLPARHIEFPCELMIRGSTGHAGAR
jgi:LacI family transcriptional regulator